MSEPLGVILDLATIDQGDLDLAPLLRTCGRWALYERSAPAERGARIREAELVVTNKVVLDRDAIAAARGLRLIAVAATGTNNLDLAAARERGIAVCNVRGYATPAVAQHVFGLILALTTRLLDYRRAVGEGAWQRSGQFCLLDYPIRELAGKTLGILGFGALGRGVARLGEAFGMAVQVAQRPGGEPHPGRLPLPELLARVDVLSIHTPLTEATQNLIGAAELGLMKPDALLINTARGGIVDEWALAEALRAGRLGGAGVDVLTQEPPLADHPLLDPAIPNLILTPHVAWASREARQRLVEEIGRNIEAFYAGEPRNRVV